MRWSPPSCTAYSVQSTHAVAPVRMGEPRPERRRATPANLYPPDRANVVESSSCSAESTLTTKRPVALMRGQLDEDRPGRTRTSGGAGGSDENDRHGKPGRPPRGGPGTEVAPPGECPPTRRPLEGGEPPPLSPRPRRRPP